MALTDTSEKIVEKYRSAVDYKDNIKFEKMQSSLNTLNSQANEYASYWESKNIVCSVFVNEEKNKCVIEVIDGTEANVLNVLKSEISKIDPDSKFSDSSVIIKKGGYVTPEISIIGGMKAGIIKEGKPYASTVGVCGKILMSSGSVYDGIVSCGHGKELGYSISVDNNPFGTVCMKRYGNNLDGDFACVRMTSNNTLTNLVYGWNGTLTISSYATNAALNSEVLKYGQMSGFASCNVMNYDVPVISDSYRINGLTECIITSGTSDLGDSGGPYFYINPDPYNTTFTFVGVHHGSKIVNGSHYAHFTPYFWFANYFTPQTY